MKKSLTLVLVAALALGIGVAYASPMLIYPSEVQLYPRIIEGPKAVFNIDIMYAHFNTTDNLRTNTFYNQDGTINHTETYQATDLNYNVVLNITNTADTPATLYDVTFAAAQQVKVHNSILGGTILGGTLNANDTDSQIGLGYYRHFGGVINGVYLDGQWVNTTWIPNFFDEVNGTYVKVPYPLNIYCITQASWYGGYMSGPINPDEIAAFKADHTINGTIPELPQNSNRTGTWFEGVPITEYYDFSGKPILTEMYINGAWVDVTNRVTANQTQPMLTVANMLVNQVLPLGEQPYQNMNSTIGEITTLPTWGDWDAGRAYCWFPWDWASQPFNNTFGPHESKLIALNNTQAPSDLAALYQETVTLYASASNYINNQPINGTYLDTASTATQLIQVHLEKTFDGYLFNKILSNNQTFVQVNALEVKVASENTP